MHLWGNTLIGSGVIRSTRLGKPRDSAAELSAVLAERLTHDADPADRARRIRNQYGKTLKLNLRSLDSPGPTTISEDCVP